MTLHKHTTQHDSWLAVSQVNYLHMPNGSKFIQHCQSHLSRGDCERPTKTEMDDAEGLAAAMSATSSAKSSSLAELFHPIPAFRWNTQRRPFLACVCPTDLPVNWRGLNGSRLFRESSVTRPFTKTPLQIAYDRKHEQLRREVWNAETKAIVARNFKALEDQVKLIVRIKAKSVQI